MSLLFGSTWIVNTSVFGGILAMVLAANAVAGRLRKYDRRIWYGLLAFSLAILWLLIKEGREAWEGEDHDE